MPDESAEDKKGIDELEALKRKLKKWDASHGEGLSKESIREARRGLERMSDAEIESGKFVALGRFASEVSHNVRNPLAVILGWAEILRDRIPQADPMAKTAVRNIIEATMRADGLMRNLSKTVKPFKPHWEGVDLAYLVRDTVELLRFRDVLKKIKITTQFPKEKFTVRADKNLMRLALFHILMNAVESFSDKGGTIEVGVTREGPFEDMDCETTCQIVIRDTGRGIPKAVRSRVFELFSTTKDTLGKVGLGLPIAKMIVESHGGRIALKSEQDKGTIVRIILPAS